MVLVIYSVSQLIFLPACPPDWIYAWYKPHWKTNSMQLCVRAKTNFMRIQKSDPGILNVSFISAESPPAGHRCLASAQVDVLPNALVHLVCLIEWSRIDSSIYFQSSGGKKKKWISGQKQSFLEINNRRINLNKVHSFGAAWYQMLHMAWWLGTPCPMSRRRLAFGEDCVRLMAIVCSQDYMQTSCSWLIKWRKITFECCIGIAGFYQDNHLKEKYFALNFLEGWAMGQVQFHWIKFWCRSGDFILFFSIVSWRKTPLQCSLESDRTFFFVCLFCLLDYTKSTRTKHCGAGEAWAQKKKQTNKIAVLYFSCQLVLVEVCAQVLTNEFCFVT